MSRWLSMTQASHLAPVGPPLRGPPVRSRSHELLPCRLPASLYPDPRGVDGSLTAPPAVVSRNSRRRAEPILVLAFRPQAAASAPRSPIAHPKSDSPPGGS